MSTLEKWEIIDSLNMFFRAPNHSSHVCIINNFFITTTLLISVQKFEMNNN